jgi:hypothetical protein
MVLCVLFLLNGSWMALLLNLPLAAYHVNKYASVISIRYLLLWQGTLLPETFFAPHLHVL